MNLTNKEQAWLERFRKTMAAAPSSLNGKIGAYTIGDDNIALYDQVKFDESIEKKEKHATDHGHYYKENDKSWEVSEAGACLEYVNFPFSVESTAG